MGFRDFRVWVFVFMVLCFWGLECLEFLGFGFLGILGYRVFRVWIFRVLFFRV